MKRIIILIMLLFSISMIFADCRLLIIAGYGNETLSNTYNVTYLPVFLDALQAQSATNPHGWALGYYLPGSSEIEGIMRSEDQASIGDDYDDYQVIIQDAGSHLVVGHVRYASSGTTTIPDPHPFIWDANGIDYCFAHNGTLNPNIGSNNLNVLSGMLYYPYNILQTDVDSEIYFLWVIQNLAENNWNVLDGLHAAIQGLSVLNDDWNMNFVFSDGVDIYAYRNTIDSEHELCYGVLTESPGYPQFNDFRIVMSTLPDDPSLVSTEIPNDALLYYPANGRTTLFKNFSDDQPVYKRSLVSGWNWESMPTIPDVTGIYNAEFLLDDLTDNGITKVQAQYDRSMEYIEGEWSHTPSSFVDLNWDELYKIAIDDAVYWFDEDINSGYIVEGHLRSSSDATLTDIIAHQEYWISYTLLPTQNMDDAFGDVWEYVYSVKAKEWTYMDFTNPEGGEGGEPAPSAKMRALEFGKGYIVKFKEDISSFTWNYSLIPGTVEIPLDSKSQSFEYVELADYEAIDIMSIEGVESIQEIGVFQDEVCVGSVVSDSLPVQVRAYTYEQGGELSFQVIENSRGLPQNQEYSVYNFDQQRYENKTLIASRQSYSIIRLGKGDYEVTTPTAAISHISNYPNPFNPTTTISFELSTDTTENTELIIYNLKGQKVKQLVNGQLSKGQHNVTWNGSDDAGKQVSSGIYLYKLRIGNTEEIRRMLLMK